jgi:hypothetical protein
VRALALLFLYNAKSYFKCFVIQLCCCSFLHHLNRWVCHPRRSILFLMNFINSRLGCPLLLWLTNKYRYVWIFALVHDFFRPVGLQPKVSSKNHRSAKEKFLGDRYHPSKSISPLHFFSALSSRELVRIFFFIYRREKFGNAVFFVFARNY